MLAGAVIQLAKEPFQGRVGQHIAILVRTGYRTCRGVLDRVQGRSGPLK